MIDMLKKELLSKNYSIIGIDGKLASGKSTLAKNLAHELGFSCIHVDSFLEKGRGHYVSALKLDVLANKINESSRPVIVEGVCLLEILDRIKTKKDYLIYLNNSVDCYRKKDDALENEVILYTKKFQPEQKADLILGEMNMKNQHDVDIAYLKSRTIFSALLAFGGILSIIVGALLLNSGLQGGDTAVFKILGAEISASGIGSVILTTSVVWAYLAYRSRPVYRHKKETKKSIGTDGSVEEWETESSTRFAVNPPDDK